MNINDRLDILKSHCFGKDLEDHVKAIREHIEEQDAIKTELYEACKAILSHWEGENLDRDILTKAMNQAKVIIEKVEADK